ncbi:alanine racemase [Lihuaxuella thermophila]|uniref:Alanine racemase n=1 Tax=Lihuaxuella thermophila TaxID=1173111 RepID=A0A1H8G563_9BACL|nr:alanine racemase [Lihuaxuella thermophila]
MIEIDLDAVMHNVREFRKHLPVKTQIMAVVKADAYGHGAVPVAQAALEAGAVYLGVAFVDEGIQLRNAGIEAPILVLGYTPPYAARDAIRHRLTITVYSEESLQAVENEAARLGMEAKVHVKVDTGMGRIGLAPEEAAAFVRRALSLPHVQVEGIFTHFATADERDKSYTRFQEERFAGVIRELKKEGIELPLIHIANSAGAIELPDRVYDMVRIGISLYGYYPSAEVNQRAVELKPALTFKTKIVHLKQSPPGTGISYGKTYTTSGTEWIATIPVGYADGFSRRLSNQGHALVRGVKVPVVGRVTMDQVMLDVGDAMPVQVGDEVVLYGEQGRERISVEEVAGLLGTISYEVTCMLGRRIPRIYLKNGQPVTIVNHLRPEPAE